MEKCCNDLIITIPVDDEMAEEAPPPQYSAITIDENKLKHPLNFEDIVRDPVPPIDARLYDGVLLNGENKMMYWIDEETNKNCFIVFGGGLHKGEESRYWDWNDEPLKEGSDEDIMVLKLVEVCWLQVDGSFDVSKLSSKTWYIVLYQVKLDQGVDEWTSWSHMKLTLPEYMNTRVKHEHKVNMKAQEKGKWVDIPVGVFNTAIITHGKIDFTLLQFGNWISGIQIRGVKIQPLEIS